MLRCLLSQIGILLQSRIQLGGVPSFLFIKLFQIRFRGGDVLFDSGNTAVIGALQILQYNRFFGT